MHNKTISVPDLGKIPTFSRFFWEGGRLWPSSQVRVTSEKSCLSLRFWNALLRCVKWGIKTNRNIKSEDQKYYTCQKRNQIPPFDPPSFVHAASSLHPWAAGRQVSTQGHGWDHRHLHHHHHQHIHYSYERYQLMFVFVILWTVDFASISSKW